MKASKAKAHYIHDGGTKAKHCSNCSMWRNGYCTAVEGPVEPQGICDYYKAK